jgi:hypothetical protein
MNLKQSIAALSISAPPISTAYVSAPVNAPSTGASSVSALRYLDTPIHKNIRKPPATISRIHKSNKNSGSVNRAYLNITPKRLFTEIDAFIINEG